MTFFVNLVTIVCFYGHSSHNSLCRYPKHMNNTLRICCLQDVGPKRVKTNYQQMNDLSNNYRKLNRSLYLLFSSLTALSLVVEL